MNPEADYNLHLIKAQMGMAADPKGLKAATAAGTRDEKKWKAALDFQAMFRQAGFADVYWVEALPGIGITVAST